MNDMSGNHEFSLDELPNWPVLVVRANSPACKRLLALCGVNAFRPGSLVVVSDEEFASMQDDVIALRLTAE